ncbi:MAG: N-6 DNA methylase [Candidatus Aminicenantes bacterium]|jgi:type I restriction-modification system DNA methylase subunit
MSKEQAILELKELINLFEYNIEQYKGKAYDEAKARADFIDKFFALLGWDIYNKQGFSEKYRDVVREDRVTIKGKVKAPDYCFRIGGARKFFVEAKKPATDIKHDIVPAFQLRRYAYTAKLPLSILTDFEEFAIYDTRIKPNKTDKASTARVFYCKYHQYIDEFDFIFNTFSKNAIQKGSFDKYIEDTRRKKGTSEVDKEFLKLIEIWRENLAKNIALRNKNLNIYELNYVVQTIIDRVIFLRIAEDRHMEDYGRIRRLTENKKTIYPELVKLFLQADVKYNSGLFDFKKDQLTPHLKIDDKILKDIIAHLYYPDSPYEFSVLDVEILGNIYEQFLGKTIRLTPAHQAKVEDKPEVKKAGGVYYTPKYIVDYIVEHTVGEKIKDKTPGEVSKLKILDPACGSGSFLLGAYQLLMDFHLNYYTGGLTRKSDKISSQQQAIQNKALKENKIYQLREDEYHLTIEEKHDILLNNIFGVDIDRQAVEVTKLSLLLKLLEGESMESSGQLFKYSDIKLLPDLSDNIKCGNSLIGSDFYEKGQISLFQDEETLRRINVFDWEKEFPEIFQKGGFDVVIGNPPWGGILTSNEKEYLRNKYKTFQGNFDNYLFFLEKSTYLLANAGNISFITPDTWIRVPQFQNLRKLILEELYVTSISILPSKVFYNVSANCIIFKLNKTFNNSDCMINIMNPTSNLSMLQENKFDESYYINTKNWENNVDFQFQIYQKNEIFNLIQKMQKNSLKAIKHLDVMQGIVPYSRENHSKEIVEKRLFHYTEKVSEECGIWIKGRKLSRYYINIDTNKTEYLKYGNWLHRPRKKKYFEGKRILIQEITGGHPPRISACYWEDILYHDPGIISCLNIGEFNTFFILGIINSLLLSWYHRYNSPKGFRQAFPKVLINDIRNFPLPFINLENQIDKSRYDLIVDRVTQMLELQKKYHSAKIETEKNLFKKQIEIVDKQIDQLVYELYGLTDEEIKIVEEDIGDLKK